MRPRWFLTLVLLGVLGLLFVVSMDTRTQAQPYGTTYVYNPTVPSGESTTLAAGYVKSSGTTLSSQAVPIPIADGGTAASTLTLNGVLYGNTTGAILATTQGAANSVLTANAGAPSFSATPTLTNLTILAANNLSFDTAASFYRIAQTAAGASGRLRFTQNGAFDVMDVMGSNGGQVTIGTFGAALADAKLQVFGHIHSTGTTPTISACGTGPAILGTDQGGRFTTGTGAPTSCLITFATAWNSVPACVISPQNSGLLAPGVVPATGSLTMQLSAGATTTNFYYVCMGQG